MFNLFYSCEIGDTVLVYYKHSLNKYIALTTRENLHFIHSDSLKDCDIERGIILLICNLID